VSKFVLTDCRLFVAGSDLTGASNKVEISTEAEVKETTNYGSGGWHEKIGGLKSSEWKSAGYWEAGNAGMVDETAWFNLGFVVPISAVPRGGGVVGDVAYMTQALRPTYMLGGSVGDVAPWQSDAQGSWPTVRGQVMHPPGTARTSTGTGTAAQLGAVPAGQALYAALHVLSVAGTSTPTITARVESDDNALFTSATTRLTFTAATARSGQILRTAGTAITDDYWRLAWTISGSTPSFLMSASFGIGPI